VTRSGCEAEQRRVIGGGLASTQAAGLVVSEDSADKFWLGFLKSLCEAGYKYLKKIVLKIYSSVFDLWLQFLIFLYL